MSTFGRTKIEEGLEYDSLSLANTRAIESKFSSPATFVDEEVPHAFWGLVAKRIKDQISGTPHDAEELLDARRAAHAFAHILHKNKVDSGTPMRAQFEFADWLTYTEPFGVVPPEACRALREAIYLTFQNEYMGRNVG